MKQDKIFLFNVGLDDKVNVIKKKVEKWGYEIVVGPTKEDEKILLKIPYYAEAKKQKIYSFMSDIWRCYKLSTDVGLYMDITVKIGDHFNEFYDYVSKYKFWAPKLEDIIVNSPILYGDHSIHAKNLLSIMKKYKADDEIRKFPILPRIITAYVIKNKMVREGEWKDTIGIDYTLGGLDKIMKSDWIIKEGSGSWIDNKLPQWLKTILSRRGWRKFYKNWKKQKQDTKYLEEIIKPIIKEIL